MTFILLANELLRRHFSHFLCELGEWRKRKSDFFPAFTSGNRHFAMCILQDIGEKYIFLL